MDLIWQRVDLYNSPNFLFFFLRISIIFIIIGVNYSELDIIYYSILSIVILFLFGFILIYPLVKLFQNRKAVKLMNMNTGNNIDKTNTVTHSKKIIKLIRKKIGFKNILISDDLSMKSLKGKLKDNTINSFKAGCNLALHCNGNMREMEIIANNSPFINNFIIKKTSQFYKILS